MNGKPLQYESLKVVLQYMEANQRFELSAHCPSIRNTERLVPIRIDNLCFESSCDIFLRITINHKTYQIGTYRRYPPGVKMPLQHQKENALNCVAWDLDRFGMRVNEVLTDYDAEIEKGMQRELEYDLAVYQRILWHKERSKPVDVHFHSKLIKILKEHADKTRLKLEPFHNRRDNISAAYTPVAQLIVTYGCTREVHHLTCKLHEMENALFQKLFGSRNQVHVKHLLESCNHRIYRLLLKLKLRISSSKTDRSVNQVMAAFRERSTYDVRLKELKMTLELNLCHVSSHDVYWILQQIENRQVEVKTLNFSPKDFKLLVQKIMERDTRRPIGTCYTFCINGFENMGLVMKEIEEVACLIPSLSSRILEWFNRTFFGNFHSFTMPICTVSSLKVSSERDRSKETWILRLKIVGN